MKFNSKNDPKSIFIFNALIITFSIRSFFVGPQGPLGDNQHDIVGNFTLYR